MGRPFAFSEKGVIVFFTLIIIRDVTEFKAQQRWSENHPQQQQVLGFVVFAGKWAEAVHEAFDSQVLIEDASSFKARGPV